MSTKKIPFIQLMFEVICAGFKLVIAGYQNTAFTLSRHKFHMVYHWYSPVEHAVIVSWIVAHSSKNDITFKKKACHSFKKV